MDTKQEKINSALMEFPQARIVRAKDGKLELTCKSCGCTAYSESEQWFYEDDEVTILLDGCFYRCKGQTTFILVK